MCCCAAKLCSVLLDQDSADAFGVWAASCVGEAIDLLVPHFEGGAKGKESQAIRAGCGGQASGSG